MKKSDRKFANSVTVRKVLLKIEETIDDVGIKDHCIVLKSIESDGVVAQLKVKSLVVKVGNNVKVNEITLRLMDIPGILNVYVTGRLWLHLTVELDLDEFKEAQNI